tara:strand:- start:1783 stop:2574 length:792 start_codon:yes stop_codon:yes gene_type:complete
LNQVLANLIESHRTRGLSQDISVFAWENEDIATYMHEEELCESYTDAVDIIEQITNTTLKFYFENWVIEFNYVKEQWVFRREINFDDIIRDSFDRKLIVENNLKSKIANLDPRAFETLLIEMFDQIPDIHDVFVRKQSYDGGFELIARMLDSITGSAEWILVQAKQQSKSVSVSQVRELIGSISIESNKHRNRRYRGLMVSSLPPTPKAIEASKDCGALVEFVTHDGLVDLLMKYQIGWKSESLEFLTLNHSFWSELEGSNVE